MNETTTIDRRDFCAMVAAGSAALGAGCLLSASAAGAEEAVADADATGETAAVASPSIYIVDRIITKPGEGEAIYNEYQETIVPWGLAHGGELLSALVAPPIWLPMDSNVLTFTWKVAGIGGCWFFDGDRYDIYDVWTDLRQRVVEQDRSYFADPADFEELANV